MDAALFLWSGESGFGEVWCGVVWCGPFPNSPRAHTFARGQVRTAALEDGYLENLDVEAFTEAGERISQYIQKAIDHDHHPDPNLNQLSNPDPNSASK